MKTVKRPSTKETESKVVLSELFWQDCCGSRYSRTQAKIHIKHSILQDQISCSIYVLLDWILRIATPESSKLYREHLCTWHVMRPGGTFSIQGLCYDDSLHVVLEIALSSSIHHWKKPSQRLHRRKYCRHVRSFHQQTVHSTSYFTVRLHKRRDNHPYFIHVSCPPIFAFVW